MSHAAEPAPSNPAGSNPAATDQDDARLASLGYQPQLHRVLGLFANFSVAFTYLSPMVGIYSLFILGLGTGGPAYIWLNFIPIIGMLFVALVFGELASHYPVAGALYQYSKFSVGPGYGWFVGWFYGFALLITVAAVDTGVVAYFAALTHNWFGWNLDPADHFTILWITVLLLLIQTILNITGAQVMGRVAQFGVYVEIVGTFGIAIILAIHGFHHGLGYLFTTQGVTHAAPAHFTSAMWNHAPIMWGAMEAARMEKPKLTPRGRRRPVRLLLFRALLRQARRGGERQGDVREQAMRHVSRHHRVARRRRDAGGEMGVAGRPHAAGAADVEPQLPHAPGLCAPQDRMAGADRRRAERHPGLPAFAARDGPSARAFLQHLAAQGGERLFEAKGCANCHRGRTGAGEPLHNMTLTDIAVDMWNHAPRMAADAAHASRRTKCGSC